MPIFRVIKIDAFVLYTYHFNVLRNILEKTAAFHGFDKFSDCIKQDVMDLEETVQRNFL